MPICAFLKPSPAVVRSRRSGTHSCPERKRVVPRGVGDLGQADRARNADSVALTVGPGALAHTAQGGDPPPMRSGRGGRSTTARTARPHQLTHTAAAPASPD